MFQDKSKQDVNRFFLKNELIIKKYADLEINLPFIISDLKKKTSIIPEIFSSFINHTTDKTEQNCLKSVRLYVYRNNDIFTKQCNFKVELYLTLIFETEDEKFAVFLSACNINSVV